MPTKNKPLEEIELYALLGEDELGSGKIGIKQALCRAGLIPIVVVDDHLDRIDNGNFSIWDQMEAQAKKYGKRISLVRFKFVEVVRQTEAGE